MITFERLGRYGNIGNSLFQYSTLLAVGHKLNYKVKIPDHSTYYEPEYDNYNYSIFDGFDIKTELLNSKDIIKYNFEGPLTYTPDIFNILDSTNIHGYFQSENYFNFCRDIILDHLQFKEDIVKKSYDLFKTLDLDKDDTTSIHVRRGDFLRKTQFHPVQSTDYYKKAVSMIKTKNYLVFSDDIEWCKQTFGKNKRVYFSDNKNPFIDLCSMSMCANNITVNSSFSWWAAWLNLNNKKQIIAPINWFGEEGKKQGYSDRDIVPVSWIKI